MKIELKFDINDMVIDTITGKLVTITGMKYSNGSAKEAYDFGPYKNKHELLYYTDSDYMDGVRHEWELKSTKTQKEIRV